MSALAPIFDEYYKKIESEAAWIIPKSDAADVASEVMLKIISYAKANADPSVKDAGAFVYAMTKNTALDFYRKSKRTSPIEYIESVPDGRADSDGLLDKATIKNAIDKLSETDRQIAVMFYFYDVKIKSIAKELNMTVSAVKWRLTEIRKKLYEIIKN